MEKDNNQTTKKRPRKKTVPKEKINGWKIAFIGLVAVLLGSILFVSLRVFTPREASSDLEKSQAVTGEPILTINSQKEQVNQIIDHYLADFQEQSDVKYEFYLKNEALLTGEFELLGFPVQFYLYFEPYVMEDGNVQLRAKSLSLGSLNLPITDLLGMVERSFTFPDWVEVDPAEKMILLRLDKFELPSGLFVKAEKINLVDDEIRFSLYFAETKATAATPTTEDSSEGGA